MANLSISTAWNETAGFVKREGRLLFPLAFVLIALPSALFQAAAPAQEGADPNLWLMLILLPVMLVGSIVGNIAIAFLALRPGASVGDAIGRGLRRFLAAFGALLLLVLGVVVAAIPVFLIVGIEAMAAGGEPELGPLAILLLLLWVLILIFISVRLMLMTPVAAAEEAGPIGILKRSWALTAGHFWKLLGFVLLIAIVAAVLVLAVSAVLGIVIVLAAGQPEPGSASNFLVLLLMAVLNAILAAFFTTLVARIYAQLSGGGGAAAAA